MYIFSSLGNAWSSTYDWAFSKIWIGESTRNDVKADPYRRQIWPEIHGKVLEIGPGYGSSLKLLKHQTNASGQQHVDHTQIASYTALEPNPFLYKGLQENAEECGFTVNYDRESYPAGEENASQKGVVFNIVRGTLDDKDEIPSFIRDEAPYDSIVTSFALCTVGCPQTTLDNIFSLLKPGGTYYFIEHVRQTDAADPTVKVGMDMNARAWAVVQDWMTPVWAVVGHGCRLNRRTGEQIASMQKWRSVHYDTIRLSVDLQARIMPMIIGKAVKP